MSRRSLLLSCLVVAVCSTSLYAAAATPTPSPVAYVYVASNYDYPKYDTRVVGYAADANGQLKQVPGSPFTNSNVGSMAANGKYLFAAGNDNVSAVAPNIYTYLIEPTGALELVDTTNLQKFPDSSCAGPASVFLDHTGATLYSSLFNYQCSENNGEMSLNISKSNGALEYLTVAGDDYVPLTFIGNNQLAYATANGGAYKRESNGALAYLNVSTPLVFEANGDAYNPQGAAADTTNHLAVVMNGSGVPQLATYTVDVSNGNLSTTSTYENMPKVAVTAPHNNVSGVIDINMAPSGNLLAVGGTSGLQVFHFNGANPITAYTGALTSSEIDSVFWDNNDHLYAIGRSAGKLFVFTVTPTSVTEAHGSPYTITQPNSLVVQPK